MHTTVSSLAIHIQSEILDLVDFQVISCLTFPSISHFHGLLMVPVSEYFGGVSRAYYYLLRIQFSCVFLTFYVLSKFVFVSCHILHDLLGLCHFTFWWVFDA